MKRAFLMLAAAVLVTGLSGCGNDRMYHVQRGGKGGVVNGSARRAPDICRNVRPSRRGPSTEAASVPGPSMGAVTYPYYTVRGPRDFLVDNPPSIGP